MTSLLLVFVHGYSVSNLDTYGELPLRLKNEGQSRGLDIRIENIFLGRYISFNDEVRLDDVARAMQEAVENQIPVNQRFVCITHSTGGPVVRNWWHLFYRNTKLSCPMSHLIMLAPANFGSALAQLGKTRLSRVKSWFDGVEPGQKILDWLELGSTEAWNINTDWIVNGSRYISENNVFPFVITGQHIDHKLYDHINAYTGEAGSDGVIRVAAANLNARYIKLNQQNLYKKGAKLVAPELEVSEFVEAPFTPLRVLSGKSHSGDDMGIMKSVKKEQTDTRSREIIQAVFDCIRVKTDQEYRAMYTTFTAQTEQVQKQDQVEIEKKLLKTNIYFHDRYSMIIFRLKDSEGYPVSNFDLIFTGPGNDPDMLPKGFFVDRQFNKTNGFTLTYYFNYDVMVGAPAVIHNGKELRRAFPGIDCLGLIIKPRPDEGFIRYLPCEISASKELFEKALAPNGTTLIEIELKRLVSNELFRFEKPDENKATNRSFKKIKPGDFVINKKN